MVLRSPKGQHRNEWYPQIQRLICPATHHCLMCLQTWALPDPILIELKQNPLIFIILPVPISLSLSISKSPLPYFLQCVFMGFFDASRGCDGDGDMVVVYVCCCCFCCCEWMYMRVYFFFVRFNGNIGVGNGNMFVIILYCTYQWFVVFYRSLYTCQHIQPVYVMCEWKNVLAIAKILANCLSILFQAWLGFRLCQMCVCAFYRMCAETMAN